MSRSEAEEWADSYPVLRKMLDRHIPLTKADYIEMCGGDQKDWTAEHDLPPPFRDHR